MELTKSIICNIIEKNYKGTNCCYCNCGGGYATLIVIGMKERNMPYAAKRILEACREINFVHFTGRWVEHVYSRNTLKWMGIKIAQ